MRLGDIDYLGMVRSTTITRLNVARWRWPSQSGCPEHVMTGSMYWSRENAGRVRSTSEIKDGS